MEKNLSDKLFDRGRTDRGSQYRLEGDWLELKL